MQFQNQKGGILCIPNGKEFSGDQTWAPVSGPEGEPAATRSTADSRQDRKEGYNSCRWYMAQSAPIGHHRMYTKSWGSQDRNFTTGRNHKNSKNLDWYVKKFEETGAEGSSILQHLFFYYFYPSRFCYFYFSADLFSISLMKSSM